MKRYYMAVNTSKGIMGVVYSKRGICKLTFPHKTKKSALKALGANEAQKNKKLYNQIKQSLDNYWNGKLTKFHLPLDLTNASDFQHKVWKTAQKIPYGAIRSYSWIAKKIGCPKGARAVGNALGENPIPIIVPCHRVVKADRGIGGFSGGIKWKLWLLHHEKVKI